MTNKYISRQQLKDVEKTYLREGACGNYQINTSLESVILIHVICKEKPGKLCDNCVDFWIKAHEILNEKEEN